jgi:hypothetical protein
MGIWQNMLLFFPTIEYLAAIKENEEFLFKFLIGT